MILIKYHTGLGDLAIIDGVNCDLDSAVITYLCYAVLISTTLCTLMIIRYFIVRIIDKKSIFIITRDPRTIFPVFFLLYLIDTIFYTALKIAYEDRQIVGRDTYITVAGCLIPILGQIGLVFYFFIVIKFLKSYMTMMPDERRERVASRFALLVVMCCMILPLCCIFGFMPVIGLVYPQHWHTFGMIYLAGIGTNSWLYGLLTSSALRDVLIELKNHVASSPQSSGDLTVVLGRLSTAYYAIISNAFMVGLFAIMFGAYDYLMRRATFMLLLASLSCPIAATLLILTVSKIPVLRDSNVHALSLSKNTWQSGLSTELYIRHYASQQSKVVPTTASQFQQ